MTLKAQAGCTARTHAYQSEENTRIVSSLGFLTGLLGAAGETLDDKDCKSRND